MTLHTSMYINIVNTNVATDGFENGGGNSERPLD